MEDSPVEQDFVAPLQIRKTSTLPTSSPAGTSGQAVHDDTSTSSTTASATGDELDQPRTRFQNFLRASYPFQPASTPSPTTVTLTLNAGDIVLVHSIHTNGWADGTLLETGARGWIPTNYCESYDYATIRPLLKALTGFWDIVRSSSHHSDAAVFQNHDYMRGIVAGVRYLLEKSDCLTRESKVVKRHDGVRKVRKLLLSDLSQLVKVAKQVQQIAITSTTTATLVDLREPLDDMLLHAFQVVLRAVSFFDIWSELFQRSPAAGDDSLGTGADQHQTHTWSEHESDTLMAHHQSSAYLPDDGDTRPHSTSRPPSTLAARKTVTHRMSYTGRNLHAAVSSGTFASEQLNTTYDAFLGVLASFLGSHMQSRSSSELLLTTQQALKACRRLLNVVEYIVDHDVDNSDALVDAKDVMYDKITELVLVTKQVFRPLHTVDDETVYLPGEGMQLVQAATACVSGAGRCVANARTILEDVGDFEIDASSDDEQPSPVELADHSFDSQPSAQSLPGDEQPAPPSSPPAVAAAGPLARPRLEITTTTTTTTAAAEPGTVTHDMETPDTGGLYTPVPGLTTDSPVSPSSSTTSQPQSAASTRQPRASFSRPFGSRDVINSAGSETTFLSSVRDSGPSFVSTSTRATSPDQSPSSKEVSGDEQEGEDEILEHSYAHELMFNAEGRVIGGTLNAIIERLTAHDSTPEAFFVSTVYLTFRLFCTPTEFCRALTHRFEYVDKSPKIAGPVRLRVYNVVKGWMESHWRHDCDEAVLPDMLDLARRIVMPHLPAAAKRLLELVEIVSSTGQPPMPRVLSTIGRTSIAATELIPEADSYFQPTILSRSQQNTLKNWRLHGGTVSILDFEAVELARQITIKESILFCSILPEELLATEFTKQTSSLAVNIKAMAQLSTDLANLVADSILQLDEAKKRAAVIKQWIKIASKCLDFNNYDSMMAIICSVNSSTILRLKKTWDLVSSKTKSSFEALQRVVDVSKNYSVLRQRVAAHVPPCLPFVGMYLTDLTFVDHGNPSTRELKHGDETLTVINLDKHMKTARVISDLQRFQVPYRLTEVPELQTWLQNELVRVRAAGERNFHDHYRRSLYLEPREPRPKTGVDGYAAVGSGGDPPVTKDKFDFLSWTHMSRDKTTSANA